MLVISEEMLDRILDTIAHHGSEEERDWGRECLQSIACQTSKGEEREVYESRLRNEQGMEVMRDVTGWGVRVICLGDGLGEMVGEAIEWVSES